ncbi:NACHT domain-containing protein [Longispora sp. K20-0274]|uniref:NACHT domain-containing protein n=1 Tax=Longispora sp. K20-0274 TaxID=3088255 RepID=UPI00399A4BEE
MAIGRADQVAIYSVAPSELARAAVRLAQRVRVAERGARASLLGQWGAASEVPFTVWRPELRRTTPPTPGTLGRVAEAYLALDGGRVVITGTAGAGKTVLALELVMQLLDRWQQTRPVPVRLSLADWDPETQPFEAWLARQIGDTYGVRQRHAAALVAQRLVLPVLDGLDEMDEDPDQPVMAVAAVRAVNRYQGYPQAAPLVITCRTELYERLRRDSGGVAYASVAEIGDLDADHIRAYLERSLAARSEPETAGVGRRRRPARRTPRRHPVDALAALPGHDRLLRWA